MRMVHKSINKSCVSKRSPLCMPAAKEATSWRLGFNKTSKLFCFDRKLWSVISTYNLATPLFLDCNCWLHIERNWNVLSAAEARVTTLHFVSEQFVQTSCGHNVHLLLSPVFFVRLHCISDSVIHQFTLDRCKILHLCVIYSKWMGYGYIPTG